MHTNYKFFFKKSIKVPSRYGVVSRGNEISLISVNFPPMSFQPIFSL